MWILKKIWKDRGAGWRLARIVIAVPVLGVIAIMLFEEHLIFFPQKFPAGDWDTRLPTGVIEDVDFRADDGTDLHGWYFPTEPQAERAILYCHGNAGNITHRRDKCLLLRSLPADVFVFDYRGYGKSKGAPTEAGVYRDARAAWQVLIERGWRPDQIIILGTSLGGGPATQLATEVDCAALVVESTFTSIPAMGKRVYPFIPSFIIRTRFNNLAKIPAVRCPVLVIHGRRDETVPFEMGRQLFDAAKAPKIFLELEQAEHDNPYNFTKPYLKHWRQLLDLIPQG